MEEGASGFFEQTACTNASSGYRSGRAKEGHIPVFTFSYPWVLLGARICVDSGPPPPPRLSIIRFANPIPSAHVCTATICPGTTAGGREQSKGKRAGFSTTHLAKQAPLCIKIPTHCFASSYGFLVWLSQRFFYPLCAWL